MKEAKKNQSKSQWKISLKKACKVAEIVLRLSPLISEFNSPDNKDHVYIILNSAISIQEATEK